MKDKLVIQHDNHCYRICWYLAEDEDYGLVLGDGGAPTYPVTEAVVAEASLEDWDTRLAEYVIGQLKPEVDRDGCGYFWDTEAAAGEALRLIRLAIKQGRGKPWPPWALAAKAAGWVPPEGWKP